MSTKTPSPEAQVERMADRVKDAVDELVSARHLLIVERESALLQLEDYLADARTRVRDEERG